MSSKKRPYAIAFAGGRKLKTFSIDSNAFLEARALANSWCRVVHVIKGGEVIREFKPNMTKEEGKIARNVEHKSVFIATCSVNQVCDGEHEYDGPKIETVVRDMISGGWLNDLIVEDELHLACPSCVQYLKDNASDYEELDQRLGGGLIEPLDNQHIPTV